MSMFRLSRFGTRLWAICAVIGFVHFPCGSLAASDQASSTNAAPAKAATTNESATVMVVVGAAGDEEYAAKFKEWAEHWKEAAKEGGANFVSLGVEKEASTNEAAEFKALLEKQPKSGSSELWLVLIGHGTYDGKEAKFNLVGPDVSGTDLATWLAPLQRPTAVVAAFSSSAPFLPKLASKGRVVITSTRSGSEVNFSRFGDYISAAIADPEADLDKDGQTSLLEAYLTAANRTAEFYETEGRLATEHPLLDDNGDGLGTPPDWFRGVRATKKAKEGAQLDGLRANQFYLVRSELERQLAPEIRAHRDELELRIAELREKKASMAEDEYYQKLEPMLLEMAELYEKKLSR